jgi:DNA repair protein RadD
VAFELRDYQQDAVEKIRDAYRRGVQSVLYVGSTGSGKTRIFSYIGAGAAQKGKHVLVVVHRDELLRQAVEAFAEIGIPCGLIKPGQRHTTDPLQIASAMTLVKRLDQWPHFDLAIFDEAHHLRPDNTFASVFDHFHDARKLLVTATPARLDGWGLKPFADEIILGPSMKDLCNRGYLAKSVVYAPATPVDMSGVRTRLGDYAQNDLEAALDHHGITGIATEHYAKHLNGAPAVVFCVTLKHCAHVADQFCSAGWNAAVIDGSMGSKERASLIDDLAGGRLNVLVSCQLLTEGVDCPPARGIILLRPTKSLTLFLQAVGRGMRPKADGGPCIILDHVGNSLRYGLPDEVREWSLDGVGRDRGGGEAPVKVCPHCDAVVPFGTECCPNCDFVFEVSRGGDYYEREGELAELNAEAVRRGRLLWLSRLWRPSKKGNAYVRHQGRCVTVFASQYGGWCWVLDKDGEPVFSRSYATERAAREDALIALLDAVGARGKERAAA